MTSDPYSSTPQYGGDSSGFNTGGQSLQTYGQTGSTQPVGPQNGYGQTQQNAAQFGNSQYNGAQYAPGQYGTEGSGQPGNYGQPGAGGQYGPGSGMPQGAYASWGQRAGAYLLDMLWTLPGLLLSMIGVAMIISGSAQTVQVQDPYTPTEPSTTSSGHGGMIMFGYTLMLIGWILALVAAFLNRWKKGGQGASWGKQKMGLRLINEQTGQPLGTGGAFLRDLAHVVDAIPFDIGYLWPLWDVKRQTFADKICTTVVVPAAGTQQYTQPGVGSGGMHV